MRRLETAVFLLIGAMISIFVAWQYYQSVEPTAYTEVTKLRIAPGIGEPIARGTILHEEHLDVVTFYLRPDQNSADFAFAVNANPTFRAALIGQRFNQVVQPGAFVERRFFFGRTPEGFAQRVAKGNRAFSVEVTGSESLLNFVAPGSAVDILGTVQVAPGELRSEVLLENVIVMAIGDIASVDELEDRDQTPSRSLTIQTTPEKIATYLERAAKTQGDLLVALRSVSPTETR